MIESDSNRDPLSPAGTRRRDAMLRELQEAIPRIHRRRRRRRALIGSAVVVIAAASVGLLAFPRQSAPPATVAVEPVVPVTPGMPDAPPARTSLVFDYVKDSPSIIERTAARGTGLIVVVDDATLVTELAAIDRHTGIVRRGGRVWLTADVIDEL